MGGELTLDDSIDELIINESLTVCEVSLYSLRFGLGGADAGGDSGDDGFGVTSGFVFSGNTSGGTFMQRERYIKSFVGPHKTTSWKFKELIAEGNII